MVGIFSQENEVESISQVSVDHYCRRRFRLGSGREWPVGSLEDTSPFIPSLACESFRVRFLFVALLFHLWMAETLRTRVGSCPVDPSIADNFPQAICRAAAMDFDLSKPFNARAILVMSSSVG